MTAAAVLNGLLFSEDSNMMSVMSDALSRLGMATAFAHSPSGATPALNGQRFDLILVDCEQMETALKVVGTIRKSKLNQHTIILAISEERDHMKKLHDFGGLVFMARPQTLEEARRRLKGLYLFVLRQLEKSIRFDTSIQVNVETVGGRNFEGTITNLSETGAAMNLSEVVRQGEMIRFRFELPNIRFTFHLNGRIVWSSKAKSGIAFAMMPRTEQAALQEWILDQVQHRPTADPGLRRRGEMTVARAQVEALTA